jgi:Family of unknown function (DUF6334)
VNSRLVELTRRRARLIGVDLFADPVLNPETGAATLAFDFGTLHAQVNVDDDTFIWRDRIPSDMPKLATSRASDVWSEALGKMLIWPYEMENQNGYLDALQFEFNSPALDAETIIQVRVAASVLRFYRVSRS